MDLSETKILKLLHAKTNRPMKFAELMHLLSVPETQRREFRADVAARLRPDYLRKWIANPKRILPYTGMPVNVPYDPDKPHLGGVSQDLIHGTSIQQLDGLADLLLNFNLYTRKQTSIQSLVKPAAEVAPDATEDPGTEN